MQHWVQRGAANARYSEGVLTLALSGDVVVSMGRRTALEVIDAMLEALKPAGTAAAPAKVATIEDEFLPETVDAA